MAIAHGVAAGNGTIAARARGLNRRVHVVPTCVDPDAVPFRRHEETATPVIGWIGTPGNLRHLVGIVPALRRLGAERPVRLRVVSSVPFDLPGIRVQNVRWSAQEEARHVASFDVGLMPLEASPATEGKCGLKLLQYAAAGVPAVASPVGVNQRIVRHGETGFLAESQEEWTDALRDLLDDADLRARLGAAARDDARRRWSYDVHEPAFLAALGIEPGDPA
jgi:glycosyltransferase involved in cell wall biosynthesis